MGKPTVLFAGVMAAACFAGGCKDKAKPSSFEPPPGPAAELVPEPTRDRPPVETGYLRIDKLDLDVKAPADAKITDHHGGSVSISYADCGAVLHAFTILEGTSAKLVGTLPVDCRGDKPCEKEMCDSLRPVPGGTAEDPYPTELPVVSGGGGGGITGASSGGYSIWADGTIGYEGPKCTRFRQHRGKLTPERVAALVKSLDAGGFFSLPEQAGDKGADCFGYGLTVRSGSKNHHAGYLSCGGKAPEPLTSMMAMAQQTAGRNPCQ